MVTPDCVVIGVTLMVGSLKVTGGTGSPARLIATFDDEPTNSAQAGAHVSWALWIVTCAVLAQRLLF